MVMAAAMFALASCNEKLQNNPDDGNGNTETPGGTGNNGGSGNNGSPTEELAPSAQKTKLEEVAKNLMDQYPSEEFKEFFELISKFDEKYFEEANSTYWDSFYEYCEEKGEEMFFYTTNEEEQDGEYYISINAEAFLEFAQFKGKLTLGETSATVVDYDGTMVEFTLDGKQYVATLKTSGASEKVMFTLDNVYGHEDYDGYYDEETGEWIDKYVMLHYDMHYKFEVEVPENIEVTLTRDGVDYAKVDMKFEKKFDTSDSRLTIECFKVTATVTFGGHSIIIEKTGYDEASQKATLDVTIHKDGKETMSFNASADVDVEFVTVHDEWEGGYEDYIQPEFHAAKNFNLSCDVLGQLQAIGKCTDGLALAEYIENFDNASSQSQAERAINNINNCFEIGLYYDKSMTRQAQLIIDYDVVTDDYYGETWFEMEPIILFPDGSKYAFYEYFDENSFSGLVDSFELWLEMYDTMFQNYL